MRSAALLMLLPLAACTSAGGTAESGSSVPGAQATASVTVAQQCENEGFVPGTSAYRRCYNVRAQRQDSGAAGAMNLFRTIGPIGRRP